MAELVVHDLDDEVQQKLQRLAQTHGRTVEEEVHDILREAVFAVETEEPNLGSRIAACFTGIGLEQPLPELREKLVEPVLFKR